MSIKFIGSGLSWRLMLAMALGGLVGILLAGWLIFQVQAKAELENSQSDLQQLVDTVLQTAAISAYLGDKALAKEIISGLAANELVDDALIINNERVLHASDESGENTDSIQSQRYQLTYPFVEGEVVGEMIINPNRDLMQQRAAEKATGAVLILALFGLVMIGIMTPLMDWVLLRPIKKLALQLHEIKPASSDRLDCPQTQQNNELGRIVADTNRLLQAAQENSIEERKLRQYLEKLQSQLRLIFEQTCCGIGLLDFTGKPRIANPSFKKIFGEKYFKTSDNPSPARLADFFVEDDSFIETMKKSLATEHPIGLDLQVKTEGNAEPRWLHCLFSRVKDKNLGSFIELVVHDISERAMGEQQAQIAAQHDPLTQLLNRRAGIERMQNALESAHANGTECALLMIDLDKFKPINEHYGSEAGDQVLQEVARRVNSCVRGEDMILRWGDDEFVIFIQAGKGKLDPEPIARKIINNLPSPIDLQNGGQVTIGASVGVSKYPANSNDLVELIEIADQKMHQVQSAGGNNYQIA